MRSLPPARSPLDPRSLGAGLAALWGGGRDPRPRLAERLAERYGARDVCLTDSGTTALRLAIAGSLAGREGFVALPAYACYDVATAAIGARATVRLYDIDSATLAPNARSIERLIDEGAAAVVVAHLFGQPAPVDRIATRCEDAGCTLIEDAAQEAGARVDGRRLGSFGSLSILSFGRGKGVTGGSGGALLVHDDRGAAALASVEAPVDGPRGLADLLTASALWALARPSWFWLPRALPALRLGETLYKEPAEPGGMSRAAAAIADASLALLDRELELRRRHADRLRAAIPEGGGVRLASRAVPGAEPGWLRLPVLLDGRARDMAAAPAAARLGIVRSYPRPLHRLRPLAPSLISVEAYPGADRLAAELYTLPTHGRLAARDVQALAAWLAEASGAGHTVSPHEGAKVPNQRRGA